MKWRADYWKIHKLERESFGVDAYLISAGLDPAEKNLISLPITSHYSNGRTVLDVPLHHMMPNGRIPSASHNHESDPLAQHQ
jgi:hypothetical protein